MSDVVFTTGRFLFSPDLVHFRVVDDVALLYENETRVK